MSAGDTFVSELADIVTRRLNGALDEATAQSLSHEATGRYLTALQTERDRQAEAAHIAGQPLRERLGAIALSCGVRPQIVEMVVRSGEAVFELKDGQLLPRDGRRHPHDPVAPLDVVTWLAGLREKDDGSLFLPLTMQ